MTQRSIPPQVKWAQRVNSILVSIVLEDCKDPTIKVEPKKLYFKGIGGTEKKEHEVTLEFLNEINPETSKYVVRDRLVEFVLEKKVKDEPYWPRLLETKVKQHYLRVDFNNWVDEDEEDASKDDMFDPDNKDVMQYLSKLGGGENAKRPSLDDLDIEKDDSDDDDLPALS